MSQILPSADQMMQTGLSQRTLFSPRPWVILVCCLAYGSLSAQPATPVRSAGADVTDIVVQGTRGVGTLNLNQTATTGSRTALNIQDTPASVEIVEQQGFQDRNATTVVDAVRHVTGMSGVLRAGAPGVYQSRGFLENAVSIQFDGIRVGASTLFTRPYDSFVFDRIEVLRGPGSALHGDSAVGGAVNYIRRKPVSGPLQGEALLSLGSYSDRRIGVALGGSLTDNWSFATSIVSRSNNTFVQGESSDSLQWVGAITGQLTPDLRVLFEVDYWRRQVDDAYWGTPLVAGQADRRLDSGTQSVSRIGDHQPRLVWRGAMADWFEHVAERCCPYGSTLGRRHHGCTGITCRRAGAL